MNSETLFTDYMSSARKQFEFYKMLGQKTLERLDEKSLHWQTNADCNSAAAIVKHLHGNMLSRWTNFLTEDGEKTWRERDAEFETSGESHAAVMALWRRGWQIVFEALDSVSPDDTQRLVYIRNQGHTITDAVNRQICHYAYHVGQLVQIGKMIHGAQWESLSIPKGQSKTFNADKFAKEKNSEHFTDEFLK
jgi:hypothetical protein